MCLDITTWLHEWQNAYKEDKFNKGIRLEIYWRSIYRNFDMFRNMKGEYYIKLFWIIIRTEFILKMEWQWKILYNCHLPTKYFDIKSWGWLGSRESDLLCEVSLWHFYLCIEMINNSAALVGDHDQPLCPCHCWLCWEIIIRHCDSVTRTLGCRSQTMSLSASPPLSVSIEVKSNIISWESNSRNSRPCSLGESIKLFIIIHDVLMTS